MIHAQILSYMFKLVESDKIEVLLSAPGAPPDGEVTEKNVVYVRDFVASLLKTAFPHLADAQIALTVQGMFNLNHDLSAFKDHLRDFLVQIRVSVKHFNFTFYLLAIIFIRLNLVCWSRNKHK